MNTDRRQLRQALGCFATGVTVVTVGGGTPHGMTANSFTAVSLEPPLVLVCVERDAVMHHALGRTGRFGISVLAAGQEDVAKHFADRGRPLGLAQFDAVDWWTGRASGAPLIAGALAHYECTLWQRYGGGDHTIFVGALLTVDRNDGDALLFCHGCFSRADSEVRT
jgi:flavin reductase (DIM6/NTAB) family NADH-FMN oxidoreductase RutF